VNKELQLYKESQPTKKTPTVTKRVEHGTFTRTIIRRDKRVTVKTTYAKPNPKKVIIGKLGDLEVYVYPYDFPNRVFMGKFPVTFSLTKQDIAAMLGLASISTWFLNGNAFKSHRMGKAANARRRAILSAYKYAQNAERM
jgi:hypothetical protein